MVEGEPHYNSGASVLWLCPLCWVRIPKEPAGSKSVGTPAPMNLGFFWVASLVAIATERYTP